MQSLLPSHYESETNYKLGLDNKQERDHLHQQMRIPVLTSEQKRWDFTHALSIYRVFSILRTDGE